MSDFREARLDAAKLSLNPIREELQREARELR